MKLLRWGPPGAEKPGLMDDLGHVRDLSDVVGDIDGHALQPEVLARLTALDPHTLPILHGEHRIGPCVARPLNFICIGINYADHAAETGARDPQGTHHLPEIARRLFRPLRRRENPPRLEENRRGGRTRRRHRRPRQRRARPRGDGPRRRLLHRQRCQRARIPDRARRHLGQGQGLRHLRPHRPLAGHARRSARPAGPGDVAGGGRAALAERQHEKR